MSDREELLLGAIVGSEGQTTFRVWAPNAESVDLHLVGSPSRLIPMKRRPHGYYVLTIDDAPPGSRYFYRLDGERDRPTRLRGLSRKVFTVRPRSST